MNTTYTLPPVGTIRGPFTCGMGKGPDTGLQYAIRRADESWGYVIGPKTYHGALQLRQEAEIYAQQEQAKRLQSTQNGGNAS